MQVKPGKCIASWLYIKDKSMPWSSHNKLPFARIDQLGFSPYEMSAAGIDKCQWKAKRLSQVRFLKGSQTIWNLGTLHLTYVQKKKKNHVSVNFRRLATFAVIGQKENLSDD